MNPRRTPEGVGLGHPSDQRSDLRGDGRAARSVPAALPGREELEAGPLPSDHRGGLDDGDGSRPATPQVGQHDPETGGRRSGTAEAARCAGGRPVGAATRGSRARGTGGY